MLAVLDAAQVRWWLAGGWGVDALVGRQTRSHKDLDLIVAEADAERAGSALLASGFHEVPGVHRVAGSVMPDRSLLEDALGRRVDLHPVDPTSWPTGIGVAEPFTTGVLAGRAVHCLSRRAQQASHRGFPLTAEHRADLSALDGTGA